MDAGDSIKGAYLWLEDKYYSLLDRVDGHFPIYNIVDPIDKIFPSMIIFLAIAILLICLLGWFLLNTVFAGTTAFSAIVKDEAGTIITGAEVTLKYANQSKTFVTDEFGKTQEIRLPRGELKVAASAENYQAYSETVRLEKDSIVQQITLVAQPGAGTTRTIKLVNRAGQPIYGELFSLSFQCTNRAATAPDDTTTTTGEVTIKEPLNCSGLIVSVQSRNFETVNSHSVLQDPDSIYLTEKNIGKGSLRVNVLFNSKPVEDGIVVMLYTQDSTGPIDQKATQNGFVSFAGIDAGEYNARTRATQKYGAAAKDVAVGADDEKTITLALEQNIVGTIKIKVVDKDTNAPVGNAHVTLKLGNTEISEQTTSLDNNALLEFPVSSDEQYVATADQNEYCFGTLSGVTIAQGLSIIRLKKFTGECGGALKVKVIDQDAKPVRNATVSIGNEEHYFVGLSEKTTDVNGIAVFNGLPSGTYAAFSFKATSSGWSDAKYFNRRGSAGSEPDLIVTMQVPDGIVQVKAVDREGKPVAFARVYFFDTINSGAIGGGAVPADANGIAVLATRADKDVFVIVEAEGFASYKSTAVQVLGNSQQAIEAKLLPKLDKFEVELLGLYSGDLSAVTLAQNTEYTARFRITIPDSMKSELEEFGLHVRVGTEKIMEKDLLVIKQINAPRAAIIKGSAFSGTYSEDVRSISSSDAKWANIVWRRTEASVNDIDVKIKVKETAGLGKKLDIHYRIWGTNGTTNRDPPSEYIAADELYANTKVASYQVGIGTLCSDKFCFDAAIKDKGQDLTTPVQESYQAKIFNQYALSFTISNAGKFDTDTIRNAELRIKNEEENILFRNYSIADSANRPIEGNVNGSDFGRIDVGNLAPTRKVNGSFDFLPQEGMDGTIRFEIIDKDLGIIAFAKDIGIAVASDNELSVSVNPTMLPSGIENEITVNAKDKATNLPVEKAMVKVKDKWGSLVASKETNKLGNAVLVIPGQSPGEKLLLLVEKSSYNLFRQDLSVDAAVLEIRPNEIGLTLNPKSNVTAEKAVKLKNLVAFPLVISKLLFEGKTRGLLDVETMNNSLKIFEGTEIKPGKETELLFNAVLSDAGKNISERAELTGVFTVEASNFGQSWRFELPVKITIGLGGEVSDAGCLTVTKKEWKTATEGKPLILELQIENNCVIEGAPIALQGLEAKVDWQSNKLGEFELMTEKTATTLRSGYFKTIINRVEKEQTINVQLTFTPSGGVNGVAKAKIVLQATNPTEAKAQAVSAEITTEIAVLNLIDCISFSKEDLEMTLPNTATTAEAAIVATGETSDSFSIKTEKCGSAVNVKLESELDLSTKEFSMKENDSKDIKVSASGALPGKYGVKVSVEGASAHVAKQVKNIEVLINPPADSCIRISRYEFNIYDDPNDPYDGSDSAKIYNECVDKTVDIKVDMHSWSKAMKEGFKWALIGFALSVLAKMNEGDSLSEAIFGKKKDEKTANEGWPKRFEDYKIQQVNIVQRNGSLVLDELAFNPGNKNIGYNKSGEAFAPSATYSGAWEAINLTASTTGNAVLPLTGKATSKSQQEVPGMTGGGGGLLGGGAGGGGMGILGMAGSMFTGLTGTTNPFMNALTMFIAGTMAEYNSQKDKELTLTAPDVVLGDIGLFRDKKASAPDTDIAVQVSTAETIEPKKGTEILSVKTKEIVFTNVTGVKQDDALNPLYRFLNVWGERKVYSADQEYKEKVPAPEDLDQDAPQNISQLFHLQFDSFKACADGNCISPPSELRNCQLGNRLGSTGERALPRIKFSWDWSSIASNECDEDNQNYVYCDATQFSIELLKKLQLIREFVETNAPFECPSLVSGIEPTTQILSTTALDIGLTRLDVLKVLQDINVVATIESNNQKNANIELTMTLTNNDNGTVQNCVKTTSLLTKSEIGCVFTNLATGNYTAKAIITRISNCASCENNSVLNDSITRKFNIGFEKSLVRCEPFATIEGTQNRLEKFIIASQLAGRTLQYPSGIANAEQMTKIVKFKAALIKDGYSTDFRKDFHDFALTRSFFDTPQYYKDANTGLGKYFSNEKAMEFDYFGAPLAPIRDPGIYEVRIDINFLNSNMRFFNNGEPIAKIIVHLEKTKDAKPASPFYYLPFNGNIGEETGRVGYGTNYILKSPDKSVKINNSVTQPVRVHDLPGSNPVFTLNGVFGEDFRTLNNTKRGIMLDVDLTRDTLTISPSKPTPVIMKITSSKSEDAYGYYALEIDKEPQSTSSFLTRWIGVGLQCSDFLGNNMENYRETPDLHGLDSKCARLGQNDLTSYGLEWCNKKFSGSVFLQGIFFTPQAKTARLYKVTAAESMELISLAAAGEAIELQGVSGLQQVQSVEDIFSLVTDEKVCITGYDNSTQTEFFWNPKFVLDALKVQRQQAEGQCLRAS